MVRVMLTPKVDEKNTEVRRGGLEMFITDYSPVRKQRVKRAFAEQAAWGDPIG